MLFHVLMIMLNLLFHLFIMCTFSVVALKHKYLPYLDCLFLTENSLVCVGYDCYPTLWSHDDNNQLTFMNRLDQREKKAAGHLS